MTMHGEITDRLAGVAWKGGVEDGRIVVIDQSRLPAVVETRELRDVDSLVAAINIDVVRGGPAIAIACAYGLALHCLQQGRKAPLGRGSDTLEPAFEWAMGRLLSARPASANLAHALRRMRECYDRHVGKLTALEMAARLLMEAKRIHREDHELCARIADNGAALLPDAGGVLTHGNTGSLATGGVGTAIGAIVAAVRAGKRLQVYVGETRPQLLGSRLTAPELVHAGVAVTLCADAAVGELLRRNQVQGVMVGAVHIAANGDVANTIGTYALAVLAKHHGVPFYVAAAHSAFDLAVADGGAIPFEERPADELRRIHGAQFAAADVPVANPSFDITPAELITAIITERGVISKPTAARIAKLMGSDSGEPVF